MIFIAVRKIVKTPKQPEKEKVTGVRLKAKVQDEIKKLFEKLETKDQVDLLEYIGCGKDFFTCQRCGKPKKRSDFYMSTAPNQVSNVTNICKECAMDIAMPTVDGVKKQPTKESVDDAMYALNKPFLDSIWESSLLEAANQAAGKQKSNVFTSYIKNISMVNYYTMTYRESDNYTGGIYTLSDISQDALPKDQEIINQFEKNKDDALRLLGYLPFEKEKLTDQPFLYSQLIGFLDSSEDANDDMIKHLAAPS